MSTPTQTPAANSEPSAAEKSRKRLLSWSSKNMFYSLAACLILVFGIWAISPSPPETQRRDAEYGLAASNAAETVDWQVWSPVGLDEDWTPSTVTFGQRADVPETLRMGWITPEQEYIESRQAENPTQAWVDEVVLPGMETQEPVSIDGPNGTSDWQLSTGFDDNEVPVSALVLEPSGDQAATTIVAGTASIPEMLTYIEALETP